MTASVKENGGLIIVSADKFRKMTPVERDWAIYDILSKTTHHPGNCRALQEHVDKHKETKDNIILYVGWGFTLVGLFLSIIF